MPPLFKEVGSISYGSSDGDFDWTINTCFDAVLETLDPVRSPDFEYDYCLWHIKMYHHNFRNEDYIALYLCSEDLDIKRCLSFSFNMTFLGVTVGERDGNGIYYKGLKDWGVPDFAVKEYLLYLQTQASKKCCQLIVRIQLRNHVSYDEVTELEKRLDGRDILSQNFKDMLLHGKDHDLILNVKDKELKAHRNIMQSRCPVFKSMLEHEMLEKNSGVVDIPDCDPAAFEKFLLYIYTGDTFQVLDKNTMLDLYFIADKYGVEYLRDECSTFIKDSLSVDIICDVIKLAKDHSDKRLLESATKYFVNNAKEIYVTVEWMSFNKAYPFQANELIIKALENSSYCCVRRS